MPNLNSDNPNPPFIVHLVYICIIFAIILIAVIICMSRDAILPAAFDNFSFAATIVSIALALVSIYVSLKASIGTSQNLGNMSGIESRLSQTTSRLESLEKSIGLARGDIAKVMTLLPASNEEIHKEATIEIESLKEEAKETKNALKALYTTDELKAIQMKAIKLAATRLKLDNFYYDYKLQLGLNAYYIDAIARKKGTDSPYLLETKIYFPSKLKTQLNIFDHLIDQYRMLSQTVVHGVFIVIISDGCDVDTIFKHVQNMIENTCEYSRMILPAVYTFSEIENQTYTPESRHETT